MGHLVTTQTHSMSLEILYIEEEFKSKRKEFKNAIAVVVSMTEREELVLCTVNAV